jgi:hypothetical protein
MMLMNARLALREIRGMVGEYAMMDPLLGRAYVRIRHL